MRSPTNDDADQRTKVSMGVQVWVNGFLWQHNFILGCRAGHTMARFDSGDHHLNQTLSGRSSRKENLEAICTVIYCACVQLTCHAINRGMDTVQ